MRTTLIALAAFVAGLATLPLLLYARRPQAAATGQVLGELPPECAALLGRGPLLYDHASMAGVVAAGDVPPQQDEPGPTPTAVGP